MHDFFKQPQIGKIEKVPATFIKGPVPYVTFSDGRHGLSPGDYAKIYNIGPVYASGITGIGVTIAVVGRSDFNLGDYFDFRNVFGVNTSIPNVINNGDSPGPLLPGEELEANLDVIWSGAIAPGATIDFVESASTNTEDGVDLSELYIVDHNLADVMTESFGTCELNASSAHVTFALTVAEQAAAEGITYTVSTGDSGAEGCDIPSFPTATHPVSVSLVSGTPFNVAVGGTMFNEGTKSFWGPANGPNPTALSYIPENVWNESCAAGTCPAGAPPLAAGGGGVSTIFDKPPWQSGVTGIPADGKRDQPDVSLTAAFHDPYLLCFLGSCQQQTVLFVSGTSASAPSFAGIMALIDQKTGSRQGQANYVLYRLAAADIAGGRKCNGSGSTFPANTCNFNDVTVGNNAVPGEVGFGTSSGKYQSTTGYDLATGLGSVNVSNLLTNWASATFTPSTTTLVSLSPTTITHGASVNVHVNVTPNAATGDISLHNADASLSQPSFIDAFTLSGGTVTTTTSLLPGGTYHVVAHYAGDQTFASSDSTSPGVSVTVNPEGSTAVLAVSHIDTAGNIVPYAIQPFGSVAFMRADVTGSSGKGSPSGPLAFLDNGFSIVSSSLNSDGVATTTLGYAAFSPGTHSIVAQYGGDSSFTASNSSAVGITVTKADATDTLTTSANNVVEGATVTLTANFTTTSYYWGPSGAITFLTGGTPIVNAGNPVLLNSTPGFPNLQTDKPVSATATALLATTLPIGANTITVQYPGDGNYNASTSAAVTVNVIADFDFAPATAPITESRGSTGMAMFTITGHTGYNSTVNFTAASCTGLPRESACTFSPASLTGNGTTTLSIRTTAPKTASLSPLKLNWWATGSGGIFAGIFLLGASSRRRRWGTVLTLLVLASIMTIVSCGGGGSGSPPPDPGTPLGTFPVTVKAADTLGVLSHTVVVTLTVQ